MRIHRLFLTLLLPVTIVATPTEDGIFAVFETNQGSFTCKLDYERVPMVVANFVGLAEGTRPWIDLETMAIQRRPFYDGLTFHRVIDGFMIQGGSPNGLGTDGPGYQFPDQMHPDLIHEGVGVLSMANSGLDTNGSQFFVTVMDTWWLDYRHAVFGRVVEGYPIVEAISKVPVGQNDRPVDPVVVHSVTIVRNGAAAQAFDVDAHGLPRIFEAEKQILTEGDSMQVRVATPPRRTFAISKSEDMKSWHGSTATLAADGDDWGNFDVTEEAADKERIFFQVAEVDRSVIPDAIFPESLVGKTLDLDVVSEDLRIVLYPDDVRTDQNQGSWLGKGDVGDNKGHNLDYIWFQERSRGVIYFVVQGFPQINLDLLFLDEESGTFSGYVVNPPAYPTVNGTFTLRPRN